MQKPRLPAITSCTHSSKVGMLQFSYMAPPAISVSAHQGLSLAWLARGPRRIAAATAVTMSVVPTTPSAATRIPVLFSNTTFLLLRLTAAKVSPPLEQLLKQLHNLASLCQKS